jgi:hypothetical protein
LVLEDELLSIFLLIEVEREIYHVPVVADVFVLLVGHSTRIEIIVRPVEERGENIFDSFYPSLKMELISN